jgi:DNA-binding SARP family transcriptional activator
MVRKMGDALSIASAREGEERDGGDEGPLSRVALTGLSYRAMLDQLPSGVLMTDGDGHVVDANRTARRMIGGALESTDLTCCELLGCRGEGGPFGGHCISRLARQRGGPLPEVRVDIALPGSRTPSVWVTAARIRGSQTIVLELRPGAVRDRRRRTEPHWTGRPLLRIHTFGRTRIESSEGPMGGAWLRHRPGELLKYLVCHRQRTVAVDELIDVFWPDAGRTAMRNVRQAVHTLRDNLEPHRRKHHSTSFVLARPGGYELDVAQIWIDVDEFEEHARRALDALAQGDHAAAEPALERAVELHAEEFLADEPYAEWALAERERLRALASKAIRGLWTIRVARGDVDGAIEHLRHLAELHPLDLEIQKELLGMMLTRGRHSEAARRLDIVRRRYRRVFGRDLGFGLAELAAAD